MDKNAPKLWDRGSDVPTQLRQPNIVVNDSVILNSTLSVDAKEFYPGNYQMPPTTSKSNIQSRLQVGRSKEVNAPASAIQNYEEDYEDTQDILRLKQIIRTLSNEPGQFDNLLDVFMDTVYPYFEDVIFASHVTELLVKQSVDNPNFRYTGARLCLLIESHCPPFRAQLHLTCKRELEHNENKTNVLLFIAELYSQLHHLNIYGALLIEAFHKFLQLKNDGLVKCICQSLKLTGYTLEHYNKKALNEVFVQLARAKRDVSDPTALALLNSVFNLRQNNWGMPLEGERESSEDEDYCVDVPNPVFYNADGNQFSSEESEFLAANMVAQDEFLLDNSDPDGLCDPEPEMDEEIQAAFREFVKISKK